MCCLLLKDRYSVENDPCVRFLSCLAFVCACIHYSRTRAWISAFLYHSLADFVPIAAIQSLIFSLLSSFPPSSEELELVLLWSSQELGPYWLRTFYSFVPTTLYFLELLPSWQDYQHLCCRKRSESPYRKPLQTEKNLD